MGCGIMFPPDYDSEVDSDLSPDENEGTDSVEHNGLYTDSDSEDEEYMYGRNLDVETGTKVQVSSLMLLKFWILLTSLDFCIRKKY